MTTRLLWLVFSALLVPLVASCAPSAAAARPPLARVVLSAEGAAALEENAPDDEEARLGNDLTPELAEDPLPAVAPHLVPAPVLFGLGQASPQSLVISPLLSLQHSYRTRTSPPERLVIPALGLDSRVLPIGTHTNRSGTLAWETAPFAVGHHLGTANPGEIGNVVLSGHISSPNEGAVFKRLPQLKVDDGIAVVTGQKSYLYRVRDVRVMLPSAIEVLDPTDRAIVTLITCVPDGVYTHRLVVRAEAV